MCFNLRQSTIAVLLPSTYCLPRMSKSEIWALYKSIVIFSFTLIGWSCLLSMLYLKKLPEGKQHEVEGFLWCWGFLGPIKRYQGSSSPAVVALWLLVIGTTREENKDGMLLIKLKNRRHEWTEQNQTLSARKNIQSENERYVLRKSLLWILRSHDSICK